MPNMMMHKISKQIEREPTKKLLSFTLSNVEFALDISEVQEIKSLNELDISAIANAPKYVLGLIKFSKNIVPLLDLSIVFNIQLEKSVDMKAVIILNVQQSLFGILVDNVSDILEIKLKDLQPQTEMMNSIQPKYIEGIIEIEEKVIFILNTNKLIIVEAISNLNKTHL